MTGFATVFSFIAIANALLAGKQEKAELYHKKPGPMPVNIQYVWILSTQPS